MARRRPALLSLVASLIVGDVSRIRVLERFVWSEGCGVAGGEFTFLVGKQAWEHGPGLRRRPRNQPRPLTISNTINYSVEYRVHKHTTLISSNSRRND
jgi:hypothetical protein